jgi:hypothetical protein
MVELKCGRERENDKGNLLNNASISGGLRELSDDDDGVICLKYTIPHSFIVSLK